MTKYRVTAPDGTTYTLEGSSQADVLAQAQRQHAQRQPTVKQPPSQRNIERETGSFTSRSAGLFQGAVLDPVEGIGQLVEHMTGQKLAPDTIREKLKSFRSYARSSRTSRIAEAAGQIGGAMLVPESRIGSLARGGLAAAAQPVEGSKDYWFDKAVQTGMGGLGSAVAGNPVARWIATRAGMGAAFPFHYGLHWPLHHLASQVAQTPRLVGPVGQRAVGAAVGAGMGRDMDETEDSQNGTR